jgi:hypothetical protein
VMRSFKKVFNKFRQKMYNILSSQAVISDKWILNLNGLSGL